MQKKQTEPDIEAIKVQYEMDRLKKIDEQNRLRTIKYLKKRQQEGKRQISAIISESTYQEICRLKEKSILEGEPLTAGDIIEIAVSKLSEINNTFAVNINTDKTMDKSIDKMKVKESIDNPDLPVSADIEAMINHAKSQEHNQEYRVYLNEMIFNLHTKHSLSARKIKALFEAHGVKTAKGHDKWQAGTLGNIIRDKKRLNNAGE